MRLTTPLALVRGLGSAKDGTKHWWAQRLSAVALVPLTIFFIIAVISMTAGSYADAKAAMAHPVICALWVLFLIALFHHAQLGLQVVLEDYVHNEVLKFTSIIIMKLVIVLLGTICVISILRTAFGS